MPHSTYQNSISATAVAVHQIELKSDSAVASEKINETARQRHAITLDTAAALHQIDLNGAQQRQIKYINKNRKMHGNGMSHTKISLVSTAAALVITVKICLKYARQRQDKCQLIFRQRQYSTIKICSATASELH